jgi:hypothetical protein
MRTVTDATVRENRPIRRSLASLFLCAGVACIGSAQLSAQNLLWPLRLISNGETVYDVVNHVTWLTDANLPARQRFGIPLCDGSGPYGSPPIEDPCVNASGLMDYPSATFWILAMNNANYQGHSNWQLPTAPSTDSSCPGTGTDGNSFGFGCNANAMGYLYYKALGFHAPNTVVPIPPNRVGPFRNFQPDHYWAITTGGGTADFDFVDGSQGGGTGGDFHYVLPMIQGKIPGTPTASGTGLQVNLDGQAVYDGTALVTWLADANLAASDTLGLARCQTPTTPTYCVAQDGSMNDASAGQFIINMNAYDHGAGYLGQTNWQLPPIKAGCQTLGCAGPGNPMGILFYIQFGLSAGTPVVEPPDIAVGPFLHLWPSTYWSCAISNTETPPQTPIQTPIQAPCDSTGANADKAEFGFSFGNGYLGTTRPPGYRFVTAYYVGCGLPGLWCSLLSGF